MMLNFTEDTYLALRCTEPVHKQNMSWKVTGTDNSWTLGLTSLNAGMSSSSGGRGPHLPQQQLQQQQQHRQQ